MGRWMEGQKDGHGLNIRRSSFLLRKERPTVRTTLRQTQFCPPQISSAPQFYIGVQCYQPRHLSPVYDVLTHEDEYAVP
jgi:hypothetical protein